MGDVPRLLIADHDPETRELYRVWLDGADDSQAAPDGAVALELFDADVDVALLDREMPRQDGVDVAERIRAGPTNTAVVMVSAVEPTPSDLDLPVDTSLQKPAGRPHLTHALDTTRRWRDLDQPQRQLLSLAARVASIAASAPQHRLAESEAYRRAEAPLADADLAGEDPLHPGTRSPRHRV